MIRKILLASAASMLLASTAMADSLLIPPLGVVVRDGAAINVGANQVAPVIGLQALKKIDAVKIKGDVDISAQVVGNNVDIESNQKVDQVNVLVSSSGLVGGGQLVGPIDVKQVKGNLSVGLTTVSNNVAVKLKK